jgi:hypothetical protein
MSILYCLDGTSIVYSELQSGVSRTPVLGMDSALILEQLAGRIGFQKC